MSYTIADLKDDLNGMLHGTTINKVTGIDNLIFRAGRDLLLRIDPQETKRTTQITNALYDDVFDYPTPTDLKGNKVIDIKPQANRQISDNFSQTYNEQFDLYKTNQEFTIEHNSGTKTIRISKRLTPGVVFNNCDSLTDNGTWSASGGATNLELDEVYTLGNSASLKFDVGSSGGYLENSDMTAIDLTTHLLNGAEFAGFYIPDSDALAALTSLTLRWGSSSSDYYSKTITQAFNGAFKVGWNVIQFNCVGLTATGSPDITAYDYLRFAVVTTSAVTGFRLSTIISKLPTIYEMSYYSKYLFRTSAGVWQERITDDTNIVNLDTESINLLLNKVMVLAAPQIQGKDATFDVEFYKEEYENGIKEYTGQYKSEVQKPRNFYYRLR